MLELTAKEKEVVEFALDLYSRICMGQLNTLAWAYRTRKIKLKNDLADMPMVDTVCDDLKAVMFTELPGNACYSIFNKAVHPNASIAVGVIKKLHGRYDEWAELKEYAQKEVE